MENNFLSIFNINEYISVQQIHSDPTKDLALSRKTSLRKKHNNLDIVKGYYLVTPIITDKLFSLFHNLIILQQDITYYFCSTGESNLGPSSY